jgi:NAD(P)H-hydrate repair Nnr-like enzyme with NAD(P)H-hydrate dehydratase domain
VPPELQPRLAAMAKERAGMVGVESPMENATAVHIASPDVHVIEARREIRLYFHGLEGCRYQVSPFNMLIVAR